MPRVKKIATRDSDPGENLEARENKLILLATNLVERRLREGTASSQEVVHYLKLGTTRERLEQERLRNENALARAKKESLDSERHKDELYQEALNAFRSYSGNAPEEEEDYDD